MEPDMLSDTILDVCPLSPGTSSWLAELIDIDGTSRGIGSCQMTEGEPRQTPLHTQAYPGPPAESSPRNLQPLESNTPHACLSLPAQPVAELQPEWNVCGTQPVHMYPIDPSVMLQMHGRKTSSSQDLRVHSSHRIPQSRRAKPRIPDLQLRLEQLTNHFKKLSEENIFLRNKLKALECVVPNRSALVSFLAASLDEQLSQQPPSRTTTPQTAALSPSCNVHTPSCGAPGSGPGSSSEARDTAWPVERPEHMALESVPTVPASRVGAWATTTPLLPPGTPAVVALCPSPDGEVPAITAAALEELKRVSPQDFRALWKHVCLQLGVLVAAAEALGPNSPQHERLQRFVERVYAYMDRVVLLSPDCFLPNMYVNLETGESERPPEEFWVAMGNVLNLSALQREQMESLAMVYRQNVVPVVRERARLASELSACIAVSSRSRAEGLQVLDAVDKLTQQLRRNVLKEHQTHCDVSDFICLSVLTPLQVGKVMAASYPYIPDGVAIMHASYAG